MEICSTMYLVEMYSFKWTVDSHVTWNIYKDVNDILLSFFSRKSIPVYTQCMVYGEKLNN